MTEDKSCDVSLDCYVLCEAFNSWAYTIKLLLQWAYVTFPAVQYGCVHSRSQILITSYTNEAEHNKSVFRRIPVKRHERKFLCVCKAGK